MPRAVIVIIDSALHGGEEHRVLGVCVHMRARKIYQMREGSNLDTYSLFYNVDQRVWLQATGLWRNKSFVCRSLLKREEHANLDADAPLANS